MMQVRSAKKVSLFGVFLLSGALSVFSQGCALRLASQAAPERQESSFLAMGSRWTVAMSGMPSNQNFSLLKDKLLSFALHYEMTFSAWNEESELRRLEAAGLTKTQSPSELFFEGLLLAQEAHSATDGVFDITIGAIQWKALPEAVGLATLQSNEENKSFRFTRDPKRLSFDGLVKGMALGEMASYLIEMGVRSFVIDAGGGNLVERTGSGELRFVSRSRVYKAGSDEDRHVWNLKDARYVQEQSEVVCRIEATNRAELIRWGALSDAFSTARLLSQTWQLMPVCEEL